MRQIIAALVSGVLFGLGLAASHMVDPAKVIAFLDVAGHWDPSLALVMGSALSVMAALQRWILRRPAPLLDGQFHLPRRQDIDARLVGGSVLFGLGWGIVGFCPGPAIVSLDYGVPAVAVFVAAMLAGMILHWLVGRAVAWRLQEADG